MLTTRQRLIRALHGQEVDRMPWAPLIDDYYLAYMHSIGRPVNVVECLKEIGADVIERHCPCCRYKYSGGVQKKEWTEGNTIYSRFETPVGNVQQAIRYIDKSETVLEFYIKTREDLQTYQYIEEHKDIIPDYSHLSEKEAALGEEGIAITGAPSTPLASLFEFYMGLENFIYFLEDYPSEMKALMEVMHKNNIKEHIIAAQSPSVTVFMYEDTSSTTISRDMYTKHCQSQMNDYAKAVQNEGKPYIVHMCGKLKAFADIIAETKMDGIDSLCPPETGDLWPWEANSHWKNKIIIGGIDPIFLHSANQQDLETQITNTIKKSKPTQKTILSTGDATAHGTPLQNLQLVTKLINKYGKY